MIRYLHLLFIFLFPFGLLSQEITHAHSVHHAFLENKGQWEDHVFFKNKIEGGNMWVEQGRVLFQLQDFSKLQEAHFSKKKVKEEVSFREKLVELKFVDANEISRVDKKGATEHYYNYFLGNDESKWASDVHGYEEFTLNEIYDGIDLRFIEQEKQIKYEFIVGPGKSPNQIKLDYSYQDALKIDKKGNLVIETELGNIIEEKPYAYQIVNGKIIEITCQYSIDGENVLFELGEYNKRAELVIDPTLVFATFNGAVSDNFGMTATYGYDGSAFTGGTIYGNSHPMPDPNAYDVNSNITSVNIGTVTTDAFIAKYSDDGTQMLWATFYGGGSNTEGTDVPHSLICDQDDNIYVFGSTSSLDFPIVNGFQTTHGGGTPFSINYNGTNFGIVGTDIYVAKFSTNGHNLLGSTYVGGSLNDGVNYIVSAGNYNSAAAYDSLTMNYGDQFRGEIMLDSDNNILIGSCARSSDFPTTNAFQPNLAGQQDGVVFKVKNDFTSLLFSSYFGGTEADAIYSVKIDSSENIVFAGGTTSSDLQSTPGVYQDVYGGGEADGFIGKLSPNGLNLTHSTYIGTSNYDQTFFVEIDRLDNVFVLGQSNGGTFPVINANYEVPNSSQFIAKMNPDLSFIDGSTVFGSGSTIFDISPAAFLVDICGNMYVSGWGGSVLAGSSAMNNMPVTPDAFQGTPPSGFDFHLMVIEREFNSLLYGTYLGSNSSQEHVDGGTSRFDKNGVVYQGVCGGCGGNSDFPTTAGAWSDQNLANNCNALTFKFDFNLIPTAEFTVESEMGCAPFDVEFTNQSSDGDRFLWDFGNGNVDSTTLEPTVTYTQPGTYEVMLTVTDSVCLITDSAVVTITVLPEIELEELQTISLCQPDTITLTALTNGTANQFVWSSNPSFTDTLNTNTLDSTLQINHPTGGWIYINASNGVCELVDSVEVIFTSGNILLEGDTLLCLGEDTQISASTGDPSVGFTSIDWSSDSIIVSGDGSSTVTVNPSVTQYVYLNAETSNGCIIFDSILVSVSNIDPSIVEAYASDSIVPNGTVVVLNAEPDGYSYSWSPTDGVENPNAQETNAIVYGTTNYTVSVSDGICTKNAMITVTAFPYVCDEPYIFVPNAFSPNGDGENDVLYVRSLIVSDVNFKIFNRWGELVYESNTTHGPGWDGTYKGKLLDPDVYDYYLKGHCIDGQEFLIKGNITLIR
ncbi:DUF7948 domain-containing protein [Brumimicrobium aurantiacum]|uniref:PKD domain-containing protein n=1 Tax=Brumimicrobium aurantiacum TaxID=1737063 RepID=A0A3E1EVU2_9FLAO|nr:gliding motility-associated C-terminal domain-containing protein [Brumimicrobium aurantiacum]RFC53670.1 PKD domain-containing protein [Brumimicrobium aurantiacum]